MEAGRTRLIIGGCTLNSCVRVSAIETRTRFVNSGLDVIVDLSLCGARSRNYGPSAQFGGRSAVNAAVVQMIDAGVRVVDGTSWESRER